ncbi:putative cytochrome P450 [Dioscorea sansibarensis]
MAIYVLVFLLVILRPLWMFFSSYILIPWRIKSIMAKQKVFGPPPRCFSGNIFDIASLVSTTTSSDMEINDHNIVGRLLPHYLIWSKHFSHQRTLRPLESHGYKDKGTKDFIGKGLLMANGQDWFHQRHIVAPQFMGDKLKGFFEYMVECSKETMKELHEVIGGEEKEVEMSEYMTKLTADIIARTEFDYSYDMG